MPKGHPKDGIYNKPPIRGSKFPERDGEILRRWNAGESAGDIKEAMGLASRHVVIGAVHREKGRGCKVRGSDYHKKPRRKHNDARAGLTEKDKAILENEKEAPKPTLPALVKRKPAPVLVAKLPPVPTGDRWVNILETKDKSCRYSEDGKLF